MKRASEGSHGDGGRRGPKAAKATRFGPHAFKVLCPEQMVAKMMSKQEGIVHQIESRTNSHLQFSPRNEYFPDTRLRILTVHAPEVGLVMDALAALVDQVAARADEEHANSKGRPSGDFVDGAGKIVFRCALSKAAAGAIIGSKGERVKNLRDRTGCQVDIAREVVDSHQICTLAGSQEQLLATLEELNGIVQVDVDTAWFAEWAEQRGVAALAVDGNGPRRSSRPPPPTGPAPPSSKGVRSEEHINCTIFVGHLAQATDAERLRMYFSRFGQVVDADVRTDSATGRSKGFGFITFAEPSMAEACLDAYDEHEIDERRVDVKRYNEPAGNARDEEDRGHPPDRGTPRGDEHWDRNGHSGYGAPRPSDHRDRRGGGGFNAGEAINWFAGLAESVPPDYLSLDYCICCSLPSAKCGALIGRRGEHVERVQRITGAVVSVSKKDPHESVDAHRSVTITGQLLSVYAAHLLLMQHYNDEEAQFQASTERERHRGGGGDAGGGSGDIEDLQRQLTELTQELSRVRGGGGGARRRSPPGRPMRRDR